MMTMHIFKSALCATLILSAFGCSNPKAVRGEDVQGLDDQAMGTGLDRRDLQKLLSENMSALETSAVVKRWQGEQQPTLSVLPFRNETSEHIDSSLDALISDVETTLINGGHVRVVSIETQQGLMAEVKKQQGDGFDQGQASQWGKQLGAKYIITGKVFTNDEAFANERRVQYFLFMQVLEVETSQILFQNKAALTKGII
jgi:penicillin-binding protein activator